MTAPALNDQTLNSQRTREVLRRLELDVTRRLDGLLQGDYRGLVSGLGSESGEAREYTAGDDVRRMDWNVTARMNEPHVRDSVADRELETTVLIDLSPSLDFGTAQHTKAELAVASVAAIGLLTDRTGNRLGAVISNGQKITHRRAGIGRRNVMALLHHLSTVASETGPTNSGTARVDLADALTQLAGPSHRGGLAVVISDLLTGGAANSWTDALRAVTLRHETLVIELVDPRELELPNIGVIELRDAESGAVREVNTRDAKLRQRFAQAGQDRLAANATAIRRAGADHLLLRTDRDWVLDLAQFVDRRRRGRRVNRQARQ